MEGNVRPRVYDSYVEQKRDQRIGFIAFPIVNLLVWITIVVLQQQIDSLDVSANAVRIKLTITWLPWVVNGFFLLWALIFRWSIGTGYLVSFAGFTATAIGLGLIGVVVFFAVTPLLALTDLLGVVIFLFVVLAVSIWFL